ncbi:penicillin-binding protein 2 [Candidatus Gracilibacteria bacterium]|nr:penicillin-binding protein 2 [Candidatus Gracilibacteria bacterium]
MIRRQKNLNKFRVSGKISELGGNFFGRKKKRGIVYQVGHISANPHLRIKFLLFFILIIFGAIISRLFFLQVIKGDYYSELAFEQQYSRIEIPARRGEIFARNSKTGEKQKLATNISLDLAYVDPNYIRNKEQLAKDLAEILFTEEDYKNCKNNIHACPRGSTVKFDDKITIQPKPILTKTGGIAEKIEDTRSMEELKRDYADDILRKISKKYIDYLPLKYGASDEEVQKIKQLGISGIDVLKNGNIIYINPTQVNQEKISIYAKKLQKIFPEKKLSQLKMFLTKRKVRYVPLKRKLSPEISEKIRELKKKKYDEWVQNGKPEKFYDYKGVVLIKEHWRYYPEKELASQVLGFVDNEGIGRYGIEEYFNEKLSGKNGIIFNKKNVRGEFVFVDNKKFAEVKDGESIVLTIDKIIQKKVEDELKKGVEKFGADKGQIIVMNPKNGEILAMANYPTFDPNDFGKVYKIEPIKKEWWVPEGKARDLKPKDPEKDGIKMYYTLPVFVKDENGKFKRFYRNDAMKENEEIKKAWTQSGIVLERVQKYMYKNKTGLDAYINNTVMATYEPGSVFKPLVVAMGLNSKEITPNTTYEEFGPIEIDTGTDRKQYIRTAEGIYRGIQTITNAMEHSSNIGMAFVARKLGAQLFYYYLKKFNFGEKYGIEQNGERAGRLQFWKRWNEAKLLTISFGQGISVTPLQIVAAWSAMINGGYLLKPTLVKEILDFNGKLIYEHKKDIIDRVIKPESSAKSIGILVSSVENGVAKPGGVKGYKVGGKTGTAQMSCSDKHRCQIGTYEEKKEGNFITSYAGFGPAENPKFLILVKYDRPRVGVYTYGSNTAALTFHEIAKFLFDYYGIKKSEEK